MRGLQPLAAKMARRRATKTKTKRRYRQNHKFVEDFEDPVLVLKRPTARQPVDWEEDGWDGDDTPVFTMQYKHSLKQLERYTKYPRLYKERLFVEKSREIPFYFLALPGELRLEIYRYALLCSSPIDIDDTMLHIHECDSPAVHLLRTCKQVFDEGAQVFYGSNQFRFWKAAEFFHVLYALPRHSFDWLKELTICVPFGEEKEEPDSPTWWYRGHSRLPSEFPYLSGVPMDDSFAPDALLQELLARSAGAPPELLSVNSN